MFTLESYDLNNVHLSLLNEFYRQDFKWIIREDKGLEVEGLILYQVNESGMKCVVTKNRQFIYCSYFSDCIDFMKHMLEGETTDYKHNQY